MIENHFPVRPKQGRTRRFRGKKRYYRRVQQKAQEFSLPLKNGEWWADTGHYHADWPGHGNQGWRHRKLHIQALCIVFRNITTQLAASSTPYQLWLFFDMQDAGQDAVYFHTPNPNQSNFPITLENATWGFSELEHFLAQWLAPLPLRAGTEVWDGNQRFFVYSTAHGEPLERIMGD